MTSPTPAELAGRIEKLQRYLAEKQIDYAILSHNPDIYYYTRSCQPLYLIVPAAGGAIVLARKSIARVTEEVSVAELETFRSGRELAGIFQRRGLDSARRVGFALDTISYASVTRFQRLFADAQLADLSWDIRTQRMAKSEAEIAIQARAGAIMAEVPRLMREGLRRGMTELDLSAVLEQHYRLHEHATSIRVRKEGIDLPSCGVCSSGVNTLSGTKFDAICSGKGLSPAAPYGASRDVIEPGIPVLLDHAMVLEGYHVDQTRMCSLRSPSDEVMRAYEAMVAVEDAIIDMLKPGVVWEDVYTRSVELAGEFGYADTFMGFGPERVGFVGHGVGLELDEPPYLAPEMKYQLAEGMVLAVEPKVALPGVGIIGVEDTLVVREAGAQILTTCPREFIVV